MTDNDAYPRLTIAPCGINEARAVIGQLHRHLPVPPKGGKFALALLDELGELRGVALVGHGARLASDRWTATVTRVATDGVRNGCSMLYGASGRVWRTMGGRTLYTYTLDGEPGTSLRAAGWTYAGLTDGGEWSRPSRPRPPATWTDPKHRWLKAVA